MLNVVHFRELIIRPVLFHLDMHSEAAENLVLGTAIHESALSHLKQLGGGPALGLYQMEPATYVDIRQNYLCRSDNRKLYFKVTDYCAEGEWTPNEVVWNLHHATAMCRIHYWRRPEPLPDADDADGMGEYHKKYYNTDRGSSTAEGFAENYREYVITP